MEVYLKNFMRELLEHRDNLNEYINQLYLDEYRGEELNALFGEAEREGFIDCIYADNRAYVVKFTLKGNNISPSDLKLTDKEELLMLIGSIGDVEKYFHREQSRWGLYEKINDVLEFQEWIQQIIMYLQEICDRTHDQYIFDSINACKVRMNGTNDKKCFNEIVGRLKSIEKNIDRYYQNDVQEEGEVTMKSISKTPKIFISHSSKDEAHVALIVKLLKDMGFNQDNVFCSTIPGYGIGVSKDISDTLLNLFNEYNLYVIFVHSPNYYGSEVSLNEMGAAWVLKSNFCSFLLPGFDYSDMKGVVDSRKIAIKIDDERRRVQNLINELYDELASFFSTKRNSSIVWESERDEFIDKMNAIQVDTDEQLSKEAENILSEAEKVDTGQVLIIKDVEGITIQAGNKIMNKAGIRREEVRMETALKELISKGYLSQTGTDIFQITDLGYKLIDKSNDGLRV